MAEERLKMALERETNDLKALWDGKEACGDKGAKLHLDRLIERQQAVVEALQYALTFVRGEKKEE